MKKIIELLFIFTFGLFFIGCDKEVSISKEVVFDCANDKHAVIATENVEKVSKVIYNNQELNDNEFSFFNQKILIDGEYLKDLGYGEYTFIVEADSEKYNVVVYVSDSRTSKLSLDSLYNYNNANIVIPIELYDATFELFYKDEKIDNYKIEDGKLNIFASFIELCGEENIVLKYKFTYRSLENPKEFLNNSGDINIKKILFGEIEW